MPNPSNQRRFHDSSLRLARASGTGVLESSLDAGWSSLLVVRRGVPLAKESFETPAVEDFHIGLVVRGVSDFTGVHEGRTYTTRKEPGHVTLAAPTETYRMSWKSVSGEPGEVLSVFLPAVYFSEAAEEYRRAGTAMARGAVCAMGVGDPIVGQVMQSLRAAAQDGMPDSYADSAARYLATHLLATAHRWSDATVGRDPGDLTDRRLARVLEYLEHQHREDVSNQQLAEVAGISPFHFARLFKRKVGCTPHQYVQRLRMQSARKMLRGTDLSVLAVASACGYANASHFAAAFCNAFGQNPGEFRVSLS